MYATLAMKAGPRKGSRRAIPRFLLFPDRIKAAAFSVLLSSGEADFSFAMSLTIYTIGWKKSHI
jgi:hypothetical protein